MKKIHFGLLAAMIFLGACRSGVQSTADNSLVTLFPAMAVRDTLHFFIPESPGGAPIADSLLRANLTSSQFDSLHFDTGEHAFFAVGRFSLPGEVEACLLHNTEFWFGKQVLLLYDRASARFIGVREVANFYGGESGQVATEGWLLMRENPPRLFVKYADHSITLSPNGDAEPIEHLSVSGELLEWSGKKFLPVSNPDSLAFLQHFQMDRTW
jgi:hypothetical protein